MDELAQAQEVLARELQRARAGEDPALAGIVREKGEQLAGLLHGLVRMSRIHAPDNDAMVKPVGELAVAECALADLLGTVNLVAVEDEIYVNDIRIRPTSAGREGRPLSAELAPHNCSGLSFSTRTDTEQLRAMLRCLSARPAARFPRSALSRAMKAAGVVGIEPLQLHRFRMAGEAATGPKDPRGVASRAVAAVEELWRAVATGVRAVVLPLRRAATEMIAVGVEHEDLWRAVPGASPHAQHAFRVGQVAMVVGAAAGLDHSGLQDLGVAALLHDIGYAHPDHAAGMWGHSVTGAGVLLGQRGFHEGKVRRILAVVGHHADLQNPAGKPSLFGRIVRIAEDYDNMIRPGGGAMPPPEALQVLAAGAGTRYEPALVQLLVNRLGRYPPGTMLRLEDGRIVRTLSAARGLGTFDGPRA